MSTAPAFTGINLSALLDGPFFGFLVSIALYGVIMVQAWNYFNQNKDKWPLQMLVLSVVAMDFAASVLEALPFRDLLILHFGNVLAIESETSIRLTMESVILTAVIAFTVQIFFASRVYRLNRVHRAIPAFTILCTIGSLACGLLIGIEGVVDPSIRFMLDPKTKLKLGVYCGLTALVDIFVTLAFMWTFRISKTGFKKTDTILYKLFQYILTRGILVTLIEVSLFALFVAEDPAKLKWLPVHFCGSKVYVITMLAMLNNRSSLQGDNSTVLANSVIIRNTQNSTVTERDAGQSTNDLENGYALRPLNLTGAEREVDKPLPKPPITDSNAWWIASPPSVIITRETVTSTN